MLVKATVLCVILLSIQHSLSKKIPPAIFNGWHGVSVDDPDVQNLAEEAVKIYSEQEKKEYKLQGVMSVQQQLVIGVNYKMDLYANRSLGPGHSLHIPLHDDVFVDAHLLPETTARPFPGGWGNVPVDNPKVFIGQAFS